MINLVLAFVWLALALFVFALPHLNPQAQPWTIPNTEISMGWFALAFFFYNMIRWWTTRPRRERRPLFPVTGRPVEREEPPREPNPDFNFSENAPPSSEQERKSP